MGNFDKGIEYGLAGFIAGLIVQGILILPDWGDNDLIFYLFGVALLILMAIGTFTDVMGEDKSFQVGFITISIILLIAGV